MASAEEDAAPPAVTSFRRASERVTSVFRSDLERKLGGPAYVTAFSEALAKDGASVAGSAVLASLIPSCAWTPGDLDIWCCDDEWSVPFLHTGAFFDEISVTAAREIDPTLQLGPMTSWKNHRSACAGTVCFSTPQGAGPYEEFSHRRALGQDFTEGQWNPTAGAMINNVRSKTITLANGTCFEVQLIVSGFPNSGVRVNPLIGGSPHTMFVLAPYAGYSIWLRPDRLHGRL